ncbi:hypothetical protein [Pelosinus fermentans]|nr:hypothetical protein [Pelosinus fermentans]
MKYSPCPCVFFLDIFAEEREKSIAGFKKYMNEQADDNCIEIKEVKSITDEDTKKMIQKYANIKMPTELQNMERTRRAAFARDWLENN